MKRTVQIISAVALLFAAATAMAQSRYQPLLNDPETREIMRDLALWEDQRVTGEGALFTHLASPNPLLRARTVEVIGRIQDPQDVAHLLPLLSDPDPRVVDETIFALGQIGSSQATAPLVELLISANPNRIVLTEEALGKIADAAAVAAVIELLRSFSSPVRGEAAIALARAANEEAVNTMLLTIHDPDPKVAWKAIHALEKFDGDRAKKQTLTFLDHEDSRVRAMAARSAGKQKNKAAQVPLIALLSDDNIEVVVNALRSLGEIESRRAIHDIGEVLQKHESHHARRAAATALGAIGSKKGKDYLIQATLDQSPGVRVAATTALGRVLGDEMAIFSDQLTDDSSRYVRAAAIEAKGKDAKGRVLDELKSTAMSDEDGMMRAAAIRGIAKAKDKETAGAFLLSRLNDPDWVVASEVAAALAQAKPEGAVEAMAGAYRQRNGRQEGNVKMAILRAFEQLEPLAASALLTECLTDPDPRIRVQASKLLAGINGVVPEVAAPREFYQQSFDRSRRNKLAPPSGTQHAVITTEHGDIEIELFGDDAPQTVATFVALAKRGFYDGLLFHRVVPNFVIQGGDPRGDGWGDAGFYIRSEFNRHRYGTGYVGIAHDGKDTGGSQFFITHSPQRRLDGLYTIFGRVTKGMDLVWQVDQGDAMTVRILP